MAHTFVTSSSAISEQVGKLKHLVEIIENTLALRDGDQALLQLRLQSIQISPVGTQPNYTIADQCVHVLLGGSGLVMTGLAGGRADRVVFFWNNHPTAVQQFNDSDGSSAPANQFQIATGQPLLLPPGGVALALYNQSTTRWMLRTISRGRMNRGSWRISANQSIANGGTGQQVTFDTVAFDVGAMRNTLSPSQIVIPAGGNGAYRISASLSWAPSATGIRGLYFWKNGVAFFTQYAAGVSVSGDGPSQACTIDVQLVAGDIMQLTAFQDSGGALNILALGTSFSVVQIAGQD